MFLGHLRELRRICGIRQALPGSYALPGIHLGNGGKPIIRGYHGDVHEGSLNGSKVRVKRLFTSLDGLGQNLDFTKVRYLRDFPLFANTGEPTGFLRKSHNVETLETSKHCPPPGY